MRVFWSWQSDNNAVREMLENAMRSVAQDQGWLLDEATREEPGSVAIAEAIERKIRQADVLVADGSYVASNTSRKLPNPNVMIEIGIAAATLGWDRVVIVIDMRTGAVSDAPFDYRHRRLTSIDSEMEPAKLQSLLKSAIESCANASAIALASLLKELNPEAAAFLSSSDIVNIMASSESAQRLRKFAAEPGRLIELRPTGSTSAGVANTIGGHFNDLTALGSMDGLEIRLVRPTEIRAALATT